MRSAPRLGVAALVAVALSPAQAAAETQLVSMRFAAFEPPQVPVLVGDAVTWRNTSVRDHTATAQGGEFDSGRVGPGFAFSHTFDAAGSYPYLCRIHPFVTGEIDVFRLLLEPPPGQVERGAPLTLEGRAAPGPSSVTIERDAGAGFQPLATAGVGPDGTFRTTVTAEATAAYRAVSGADVSPPVQVAVAEGRSLRLLGSRRHRRIVFRVAITPPRPGATVVLQLFLRERFGWWPVARARLDRRSLARFSLRRRRAVARVVMTERDGATVIAASNVVRVGRRRALEGTARPSPPGLRRERERGLGRSVNHQWTNRPSE